MPDKRDEKILDSWKEIAVFLRRGVRTVQRWERTEGLPVRRHGHQKRGSVYAMRSEVALWVRTRQFAEKPAVTHLHRSDVRAYIQDQRVALNELRKQLKVQLENVRGSWKELQSSARLFQFAGFSEFLSIRRQTPPGSSSSPAD